jgi:hypothetical protein
MVPVTEVKITRGIENFMVRTVVEEGSSLSVFGVVDLELDGKKEERDWGGERLILYLI